MATFLHLLLDSVLISLAERGVPQLLGQMNLLNHPLTNLNIMGRNRKLFHVRSL